jgi:pyridoxine/pyridoxamine 5'-phosphate oxidase
MDKHATTGTDEGQIMKITKDESEQYFNKRPEGSKISAWISPQSKEVPSREYLERLAEELGQTIKIKLFHARFIGAATG